MIEGSSMSRSMVVMITIVSLVVTVVGSDAG